MWKTTDRYVQQKRVKAVEAELKLKQVYVPQYNITKSGASSKGASIYNGTTNNAVDVVNMGKPCESCSSVKSAQVNQVADVSFFQANCPIYDYFIQWFPWSNGHLLGRLCQTCWDYWKKYAGLKNGNKQEMSQTDESKRKPGDDDEKVSDLSSRQLHKYVSIYLEVHSTKILFHVCRCSIVNCGKEFKLKTHLARHYTQTHGIAISSGSPRPIMKTRTAFYLQTNPMTRLARIICRNLIKPKKAARQTSYAINTQLIKQECMI